MMASKGPTRMNDSHRAEGLNAINIPPCWSIVSSVESDPGTGICVVMNPGAGWGSGAHPSTRLCLQAIAAFAPRNGQPWQMLDFGSGSGILSIAAAKLGATVTAIDIDEPGLLNAAHSARLNQVEQHITHATTLEAFRGPFEMVVANILRPILLSFATELCARLKPGGALILSGLVATDLPEVSVRYINLLGGRRPEVYQHGDWRALAWRPKAIASS
jgi:ribosomal protein L11 methyltransferase